MRQLTPLLLCAGLALCPPARAQQPDCPPPTGHIDFASSNYSSRAGVDFKLTHFSASLVPQGLTAPLCWQKFTVISHATIFVSNESLTQVFTAKIASSDSKIKNLLIVNTAEGVTLSGTVDKILPIHFSIAGPVTTDGKALLLHVDKIKADGIPVKALLELIGKHLNSVLGMKNVGGISVQENTILFFPEQLAHIKGNIHSVSTGATGLTLTYTPRAHPPARLRLR